MKRRIIQLGLPAPMSLVPHLLRVVEEWHSRECGEPGCRVYLGDGGVLHHYPPTDQVTPVSPDSSRVVA